MQKLNTLVENLDKNIAFKDAINTQVSQVAVSWQIDHCLKVIITVCESLNNSNPKDYRWKFNHIRTLIFFKGSIPRGKVKAPKAVQSFSDISLEDLNLQLILAKKLVAQISELPPKSNFKHPIFGVLNVKQAIKFLNLHTHHHVKIINDIVKK